MIKPVALAAALAAIAVPAFAQSPTPGARTVLPADPGLRAVACAAVLEATVGSMKSSGASTDELTGFAERWKARARSLAAAAGGSEADVDARIADQAARTYTPGQGLLPGTFTAAQTCQAEAEPLPAAG